MPSGSLRTRGSVQNLSLPGEALCDFVPAGQAQALVVVMLDETSSHLLGRQVSSKIGQFVFVANLNGELRDHAPIMSDQADGAECVRRRPDQERARRRGSWAYEGAVSSLPRLRPEPR